MRVEESGQESHVPEIDVLHGLGHRARIYCRHEPVFHDNDDVLEHLPGHDIQHAGGTKHGRTRLQVRGLRGQGSGEDKASDESSS